MDQVVKSSGTDVNPLSGEAFAEGAPSTGNRAPAQTSSDRTSGNGLTGVTRLWSQECGALN